MERSALLTPGDVIVIRRYVQTKYGPMPGVRQAEIVADAIRSALESRLPDWPPNAKTAIAGELIRRCLVLERREVIAEDVLAACSATGIDAETVLGPLERWARERTNGRWSRELLEARFLGDSGNLEFADGDAPVEIPRVNAAGSRLPALVAEEAPLGLASAGIAAYPGAGNAMGRPGGLWRRHAAWLALALALTAGAIVGWKADVRTADPTVIAGSETGAAADSATPNRTKAASGMPEELKYAEVDAEAVKSYLRGRDSLLADEPYFGAIVASARRYDVNPLLLFAVTGQEQGFVPRDAKNARTIANNPFNVFHSWQEYNTDIADSSAVAAKTIAKRSALRPKGVDAIEWLNGIYAEDPAWSDGVSRLFRKLSSLSKAEE